jgi:pyrimidine-specific ribonucleoside hydrolase
MLSPFLLIIAVVSFGAAAASSPTKIIVDTDMGMDVDDVGAVTLANALHMSGEAELLAVVHDTGYSKGVGGVSAINTFYNNSAVEVGAYKGTFGDTACDGCAGASGQDQYLGTMISVYSPPIKSYDDCDDAWVVYRRVLAAQPDNSVTIASIGMLTNLYLLFQSEGDEYSPLSGIDLVAQKVEKVVYMDGGYNFGCAAGYVGETSACDGNAEFVVENWPANVTQYFMDDGGR